MESVLIKSKQVFSINYIPTEEDRENDRLAEEWKERRREEARQTFIRQQSRQNKYAI